MTSLTWKQHPDPAEQARRDALIWKAWYTFQREYPDLFATHPGEWVAYHGKKQVGLGPSREELWQQCLRQGLPEGEFWVFSLDPIVGEERIGMGCFIPEEPEDE